MESWIEERAAPKTAALSVGAGMSEYSRAKAQDITMAIGPVQTLAADIEAHVFDETALESMTRLHREKAQCNSSSRRNLIDAELIKVPPQESVLKGMTRRIVIEVVKLLQNPGELIKFWPRELRERPRSAQLSF